MIIVFLGSAAFHATLTYTGQLFDELPMIYGSLMLHHAICAPQDKKAIIPLLVLIGAIITVLMIVLRESPLPLQLGYGALVVSLLLRSAYISYKNKRLADTALLSSGCVIFAIAFTFWVCTCPVRCFVVLFVTAAIVESFLVCSTLPRFHCVFRLECIHSFVFGLTELQHV